MSDYDIAQRQASSFLVAQPQAGTTTQAQRAADESGGVSCRLGDASCASAHAASVSRSALRDGSMLHRSLRHLQRDFGNRYVGQVIHRATGDAAGSGESSTDAIERSIDAARGGGQGMDHGTRSRMESAFGADFSGVRIHHDSRADGLSESLSARAFTTGRDVFFRQGEYSPGTSSGRELLAHELTHVVQQNGDGVQRKMTVSQPGDPHEVEADQMARAVMQQEHAVQRQPEAPVSEDEEKKKLHMKADSTSLMREEEEQKQE
ncbi:eCIS core domain-containing protein [Variovorax sp. GT1P44]|uniref:eCIS core domain-containing protein n=1 Tax=Variovorax sp. GT1P44 TaxID=3443742 RepID=UPI003F478B18